MDHLGGLLRNIRTEWGLSLREVKDRSEVLARRWGNPSFAASFSHLAKLELGHHDLKVPTLVSLAHIYSRRPASLVEACLPADFYDTALRTGNGPNVTTLVTEGRLLGSLELSRPGPTLEPIPEATKLVAPTAFNQRNRYRRAIIGKSDRALYPMIRPGAIVTVDTHQRSIASHKEWTTEFDRPIYLLYTRNGYICGWCQFSEEGRLLNVVSHLMSKLDVLPLLYGKDVEVVGRVVEVTTSLTA